jgi:hypothetical protein
VRFQYYIRLCKLCYHCRYQSADTANGRSRQRKRPAEAEVETAAERTETEKKKRGKMGKAMGATKIWTDDYPCSPEDQTSLVERPERA